VTSHPGWIIHRYGTVSSTMEQAAALARYGARERTIVVADEQAAGRGRAGRIWQSLPGSGLYCTAIMRPDVPPERLPTLPLVVGIAVAETLEEVTGAEVRLKWPNDLWLGADPQRQKVGGVLAASRLAGNRIDSVLVGIGVNLSTKHDELPPGATSVLAATKRHVTPLQLLDRLLPRLETRYAAWRTAGGRPALDAWRARAALLGEEVSVVENGRELVGMFHGIDDDGALLLCVDSDSEHPPGGATPVSPGSPSALRRIVAGDLVRGPRAPAQVRRSASRLG
jgi:BirA family transcriptional regulator, biotin operon repressor / biotin---[acetyl-CoA-carboxylase] ligase